MQVYLRWFLYRLFYVILSLIVNLSFCFYAIFNPIFDASLLIKVLKIIALFFITSYVHINSF